MISDDNYYKQVDNLYLTDYQREVLEKNGIDLKRFSSNHELIYYLENVLNMYEDEDLESVSEELSEIEYYNSVNK